MKIDGKQIADEIIAELKQRPKPKKFLAVFLIGDDSASVSFVRQKEKTAKELSVDFRIYKFPSEITNDKLRKEILKIAGHKTCGGAIVQLPLPEHLNWHYVLNAIPLEKDVDVLGERALGAFYNGRSSSLPPAVGTVKTILRSVDYELGSKKVAIIGLGMLVGKPISLWLERKAQDLILLRKGSDFSILKQCDLVITGVGRAGLIKAEALKDGAGVIDFGYGELEGKMAGDFCVNGAEKLLFYTPTPGGTGPVLVTQLFENFFSLGQTSAI